MRGDFPTPGQRCWSHFCGSYGLPDGLPERIPLIYLGKEDNHYRFRDENGRQWMLQFPQFNGTSFQFLDGEYCSESHPRFAEWIRHYLSHLDPGSGPSMADTISHFRWMLERNGFDPDQPPRGPCPTVTPGPETRLPNPRLPVPPSQPVQRMRT